MSRSEASGALEVLGDAVEDAARIHRGEGQPSRPRAERPTPAAMPGDDPRRDDAPGAFYLYTDETGQAHIVDDAALIPAGRRTSAKRWIPEEAPADAPSLGIPTVLHIDGGQADPTGGGPLHVPSFVVGILAASLPLFGYHLLRARPRLWLKIAGLAVGAAIAATGYFGWLRGQVGLGGGATAHPGAVLEDARGAARLLEDHNERTLRALDAIGEPPKSGENLVP